MKRVLVVIMAAVALAACAVLTTSESAGEPILGQDSLMTPPDDTTPRQEVTNALALFKASDYDGALKLWREAVKRNADMPPAQVIMAQLFFQANMLKEAQSALEQAVSDEPSDPEAYMIMAGVAMRDRDISKAESLYQKAGTLMSTFDKSVKRKERLQPWIYNGLARVAEARKDWAGAQKALDEWLKLDPKNTAAMQRLATCLLQQKNVEGALERLREAAKADTETLTPEAILAQFYQRSGDRENAWKWMAVALNAAPKDLKTRLAACECALETGQMDEAQKHAVAAMQMDPKSIEAEFFRGLVALCQKDYRTAESYFESVLKRSPRSFPISNNLALALIEQNDESKNRRALEYAEANAKQAPKSANAASTYGWVLYRLGRLDDAENALRTAASAGGLSVDTAYFTARVSVDRGRKAEAKQLLESALKSTGRAMFRQEAEDLLEQLKK